MRDPWASGLLSRNHHADRRLVEDPRFAEIAGIPHHFLWTNPDTLCTPREVAALESLPGSSYIGVAYAGRWPKLTRRMQLLTAKLMRNRQDARLRLVEQLWNEPESRQCDVLLIPDLADQKVDKRALDKAVATLKIRAARGLLSVVAVPNSTEAATSLFGEVFGDIAMDSYLVLFADQSLGIE